MKKLYDYKNVFEENKNFFCISALIIGIALRFVLTFLGHNFDFESYCIVGKIVNDGGNVYASTSRYNYGPVFFTIMGLFYNIASNFVNTRLVYRILIVSLLTLADISIAKFVSKKAGLLWGILFFLNPISLIITGYHNQFDNIAVALALWGALFLQKNCSEKKINFNDIVGICLLSISLITKHVFFAFPAWILLNKNILFKKKIIYAFIPPILFLLSFIPYVAEGWNGILKNVFFYSSFNNFPLFAAGIIDYIYPLPQYLLNSFTVIFFSLIIIAGYIFKNEKIEISILFYTISLVCCSSAIANQYIVIPCAALMILLNKKSFLYFLTGGFYLCIDINGLHIPQLLAEYSIIQFNFFMKVITNGKLWYTILAWILLFLLFSARKERIKNV